MITVLTPTYNRALLLPQIYKSLIGQTSQNFEWLIVDDGSIDNTEQMVQSFIDDNRIVVRYYKKENGGKHSSLNFGVARAKGDHILILDSDDTLTPDAIEFISTELKKNADNKNIAGIAGRRVFKDGRIVGTPIYRTIETNSLAIRYKHHITGDLVEVFKTAILKEFPFPEYEGEKFCPEALVWNRIAQKYNLIFTNKGFYITEYLPGGITDNMFNTLKKSPIATTTTYAELSQYDIPLWYKIRANINFWRYSFYLKENFSKKWGRVNSMMSLIGFPIGCLMFLMDKRRR